MNEIIRIQDSYKEDENIVAYEFKRLQRGFGRWCSTVTFRWRCETGVLWWRNNCLELKKTAMWKKHLFDVIKSHFWWKLRVMQIGTAFLYVDQQIEAYKFIAGFEIFHLILIITSLFRQREEKSLFSSSMRCEKYFCKISSWKHWICEKKYYEDCFFFRPLLIPFLFLN